MQPPAEHVHWMFATGFLLLALFLLSEVIVGPEVWRRRSWRAYLWPSFVFLMGVLLWPVMTFFTNSTIHMVAHGMWAQAMMLAGAAELGLVKGKLHSALWRLATPFAFAVSGIAFLVHEQNPWLFQRSAFLHHVLGWTFLIGAIFPLMRFVRPRWELANAGLALVFVVASVALYSDRDLAPIFGHLSPLAGEPHR
jgi:membrane protein YdbS with pleckstrin-like domain